ncbi:uncharacterized protein LOC122277097 [Carya illinoinensis]|uniref:uncharacterized protein LOC122277097 n=1 Tax=Carya illinoinensis TaxID=32201 RepID=UPI001C723A70|nr:uncharacterized protein LOC122277097 [Carya illinoinensis]
MGIPRTFFRKLLTYVSSEDDSDVLNEEVDGQSSRHCPSRQRRNFIRRDHTQGHERLFRDYFAENPVYPSNLFRMSRLIFLHILNEVESYEPYFLQRRDNAGRLGLSPMQKITTTLRMLVYGVTGDFTDEYIRIGESTAMESLKKFSETIVSVFSDEYLRSPNANDIVRLLVVGEQRGFPGMLGSIDCIHWKWKNCPAAWKYERDDSEDPNIEYDQLDDELLVLSRNHTTELTEFIQRHHQIRDSSGHH